MIAIIDYKAGNIKSIQNMLKKIGAKSEIVDNSEDLKRAKKIILPGVGHFDHGMKNLRNSNLIEPLNELVIHEKTPILGICLGAQLLGNSSEEGDELGLGWIPMEIKKFDKEQLPDNLKVPHMGWNYLQVPGERQNEVLFKGMTEEFRYYFVHTYYMHPKDSNNILSTTNYGHPFTSGVVKENIFGVQFHPEKSHVYGMQLLKNFIELV